MKLFMQIYLLSTLSVNSLNAQQFAGIPFFRNYSVSEYKAHSRNFDVTGDECGNRFFANFEGILWFDGSRWKRLLTPEISRITALYRSDRGTIYAGGYNTAGCLENDSPGKYRYKEIKLSTNKHKPHYGEVKNIIVQKDGIVFIAQNGLIIINSKDTSFVRLPVRINGGYPDKDKIMIQEENGQWLCIGPDYKITRTPVTTPWLFNCAIAVPGRNPVLCTNNGIYIPHSNKNFLPGTPVNHVLALPEGLYAVATSTKGVLITDSLFHPLIQISEDNGLCSNKINRVYYAQNGQLWCATEQGISVIQLFSFFTRYSAPEGLKGEVLTIIRHREKIYAGTSQGLFILDEAQHRFHALPIYQTCWQLRQSETGELYAATSSGLFRIDGHNPVRLNERFTLSIAFIPGYKDWIITGETSGIYLRRQSGKENVNAKLISALDKAVDLELREKSMLKIVTAYGESYLLNMKSMKTVRLPSLRAGSLRKYKYRYHGKLNALQDFSFSIVYPENESKAWFGGDFGLIHADLSLKGPAFEQPLKVYLQHNRTQASQFLFSTNGTQIMRSMKYSYRIDRYQPQWSTWQEQPDKEFSNLSAGNYTFEVRAMDEFGKISPVNTVSFNIPAPVYLQWYSILFYLVCASLSVYGLLKWRTRNLQHDKEQLEIAVTVRTRELAQAQETLIRQEKMATVGALTKGVVDRILNPLNYINNFTSLSSKLTKELKESISEMKTVLPPDRYTDTEELLDVIADNLKKTHEHGQSTARIIRAMEEILRHRPPLCKPINICSLCIKCMDTLKQFYQKEIDSNGIRVTLNVPDKDIIIQADTIQLEQVFLSILSNGLQAILRSKQKPEPVSVLSLEIRVGETEITVEISDNGTGIEENILPRIFDPFFTTRTTSEAAGTGLYLSREIITEHHGTITIESVQGKGSKVSILLPL